MKEERELERELSLAMNTGKQIVWYQGWEPSTASRLMLLTS